MRHALVAYGVVLVVLTMLARRFEAAGWTAVGALDVAAALVDALLVVAVAAALLLAGRLALEGWARSMAAWRRRRAHDEEAWDEAEVIGVTSWRPGPPPLPPAPPPTPEPPAPSPAGFTYVGPSYAHDTPATPPFPETPGSRI